MSDVTLSSAVRSSLLSLQNTTDLIDRTQQRLSSGLRVSSAVDDPVSFFQAKSLNDRAFDFTEKKDGIDQGVSSLSVALEGIEAVENIVRQLKGITSSLKSATGTQFTDLITQYSDLRTQIGLLVDDSTYQGTNLVNNTSETLSISFSDKTGSLVTVNAANLRESGLGIDTVQLGQASNFDYAARAAGILTAGEQIVLTFNGSAQTIDSATTIAFSYGTVAVTLQGNTAESLAVSAGDLITLTLASAAFATLAFDTDASGALLGTGTFYGVIAGSLVGLSASELLSSGANVIGTGATTEASDSTIHHLVEGNSTRIDAVISELDSSLASLRASASTIGGNVALLQTRLDFTETYVDNLETGASKLTLADINEEGANLLALQTRQQLGISSLSFAGQAEQGILGLFR